MLFESYFSFNDNTCLYRDPYFDLFYAPSMSLYLSPPSSLYYQHHPFLFHAPFLSLSLPTMLEASLVLPNIYSIYYNII